MFNRLLFHVDIYTGSVAVSGITVVKKDTIIKAGSCEKLGNALLI